MTKLQNDFTTPEQSKRLLEIGVPADSANCCLRRLLTDGGYCERWKVDVFNFIGQVHDDYLPCWSVGRLMEIFSKCYTGAKCYYSPRNLCKTEFWIERFNRLNKIGFIDFSKLEE